MSASHGSGTPVSRGCPRGARRYASSAANLGGATGDDPRQARARRRRAARLGELREAGRAIKADVLAKLDAYLVQFERAVTDAGGARPLGARRRRGEPDGARDRPRARRHRGRQGQVADDRRDRAQRRARRRRRPGDRDGLRRADPATRRRLVLAHPGAGDPPQPHRDPRPLPPHDRRRIESDDPRALAEAARLLPARAVPDARMASAARTSGSPRPARSASSSPRATAACARRCRPCWSRSSGSRSSCRRFADLEVFLQLLPRSSTGERMNPYTSLWTGVTPGTARRSCTSSCSMRDAPACCRRGRPPGARTASAAAPA